MASTMTKHSHTQVESRVKHYQHLPLWIETGCFFLALNAGMVNVIGLVSLASQSVTHMTGISSLIAIHAFGQDWSQVIYLGQIILCFFLGTAISGTIVRHSTVKLGRRYATTLYVQTGLLGISWWFMAKNPHDALLFASMASGIQNALASNYSGFIVRTTHLTGVITDLGLALGHCIRGLTVDRRRIIIHLLILIGFMIGGFIGVFIYHLSPRHSLMVPTLLTLTIATIYYGYYVYYKHIH